MYCRVDLLRHKDRQVRRLQYTYGLERDVPVSERETVFDGASEVWVEARISSGSLDDSNGPRGPRGLLFGAYLRQAQPC